MTSIKFSKLLLTSIFLFMLMSMTSCEEDGLGQNQYGIFDVLEDETTIQMDGVINSRTLDDFNDLIADFPNIEVINIKECDGSSDDEVNLQVALKVFQEGIRTHLMDDGLIASGGVDFFLAGIKRTKGTNTQIGVHSWGGQDDNGNMVTATDFEVGHEHHLPYINYYMSVGFTQEEAEKFYYFTINAASADDIHWMNEEEIQEYHILKE